MSHTVKLIATLLTAAIALSPAPLMAKPNTFPGENAEYLPKLSPETIEKRKKRAEKRERKREERRLKRLQKESNRTGTN